jgi:predicted ArsR family transcriptional regulator
MVGNMEETISIPDCTKMVRRMGNMFGLLYYHFAKTLVDELGEEKGKELITKAVHNYGEERGRAIREEVLSQGLKLSVENFYKFSDLPEFGWESDEEGVTYCCYAQPWLERNEGELGKLYCEVDIAKIKAYNPKIKVKRLSSILEGKHCCKYQIE